jgi:hypothetical protein
MSRILVLNNYSISRVLKEISEGKKPSHHLYGIVELMELGYEIITVDTNTNSFSYKIGKFLSKIPLCNIGDLYLQLNAIKTKSNYDFIYAPCQDVTILLGVLNYFHLFKKPIIALAHHPFLKGRFKKFRKYSLYFSFRGHYKFPSLSSQVANQIDSIAKQKLSDVLPWGPDLMYYSNEKINNPSVTLKYDLIAIGRTGRDYVTFIKAFTNSTIKIGIYCNKLFKTTIDPFNSPNIDIHYLEHDEDLNYKELVKLYSSSKIIAIPLTNDDSLCGLTSISDAIGCGMPVLMTYNKYVDLNPKELGFGNIVEFGNSLEWVEKANEMLANLDSYNESLTKVALHNNIKVFTSELIDLFNTVK